MTKRVLFLATNYGLWVEELQAPWDALVNAGFEVALATHFAKTPLPLAISMQDFIDPLQGYNINPPEVQRRCKEIYASGAWDKPLRIADAKMSDYDAVAIVGGSGAPLDLNGNINVHRLILEAVRGNKLVAALCYGVCSLVWARDPQNGYKSVIYGKRICSHPREWDFYENFPYTLWNPTPENKGTDLITPGFNYTAQPIIEDAVGPKGECVTNPKANRDNPVVVKDWPFLTGISVESSIAFGKGLVSTLKSAPGARQP